MLFVLNIFFYGVVKHVWPKQALHHLLDALDVHGQRYLMAVLPAGIRELYRVEQQQFERFHKFKGKV